MAEKLYKAKCIVHSDGMCDVAKEQHTSKKQLSKLRRRIRKKAIQQSFIEDGLQFGEMFNPYDLNHIAQIDKIIKRRK